MSSFVVKYCFMMGKCNLKLHYVVTYTFGFPFDPFKGSLDLSKIISKDVVLGFSDPTHELYRKNNRKIIRKMGF